MQSELKALAKRLARRKHRKSYLIGFSDCGLFAIWQGALHGNVWKTDLNETRALVSNGARKPV
jgi:hypothetical protein